MAHAYNLVGWGTGFEEMDQPVPDVRPHWLVSIEPSPIGPPVVKSVDVSAWLGPILKRRGLTHERVARSMHMDTSMINLWCQGRRRVPVARVPALADALGVPPEHLVSGPPVPPLAPQRAESAFARWLRRSPLEQAGMTTSVAHAKRYEFSCLNCGRGTGRDGAVGRARALPLRSHRCAFCGGFMLCEELMDRETSRLARDLSYPSVYRDEREVA